MAADLHAGNDSPPNLGTDGIGMKSKERCRTPEAENDRLPAAITDDRKVRHRAIIGVGHPPASVATAKQACSFRQRHRACRIAMSGNEH